MRPGLIERIEAQIDLARAGPPARIQMKCNALIDEAMIDALYRASQAGVPIDLWIRGICALRPGVPGCRRTSGCAASSAGSSSTRGSTPSAPASRSTASVWIGSADLMHRNLDRRVELLVRVTDPAQRAELRQLYRLAMDPSTRVLVAGRRRHLDPASPGRPARR